MSNVYGSKPQIGACIFDFMKGKDDIAKIKSHYDRAFAGESFNIIEDFGQDPNRFYYEIRFNPIYNKKNEIIGVTSFSENITERLQVEKSLKDLSIHNKMILDNAAEGIYGLDLEGKTTFINPAAAKMIGWEVNDILGKNQHDLMHHTKADGSTYNQINCPIYAAFQDGKVHHINDEVFWRKNGSSFPVDYISTPIRDEKENITGVVVTFRDISARKQAEDDLKKYHDQLEEIVKERTKELENKNKELDKAMRVFVGRELKIKEMEEAIRVLKGQNLSK